MRTAIEARVSTERPPLAQTLAQQGTRRTAPRDSQGETWRAEARFRAAGESGAPRKRPGVERWRERRHAAMGDRGVIASPERLARTYGPHMVLREAFAQTGGRLEFLAPPLGQDPQAPLLWPMRGAVAAYARTVMAEPRRRGRQRQLRAGLLWPWPVPPSGYRWPPDRPRDPAGGPIDPGEGAIGQA
jgi:resolvase-like protein